MTREEIAEIVACGDRMMKAAQPCEGDVIGTAAIDIITFLICQRAVDLPGAMEAFKVVMSDIAFRLAANYAPNTKGKNNVN